MGKDGEGKRKVEKVVVSLNNIFPCVQCLVQPSFWLLPSIPVFYHIKKQLGKGQSLYACSSCFLHVVTQATADLSLKNLLNVDSSVHQHLSEFGNDYSNIYSLPGLLVA